MAINAASTRTVSSFHLPGTDPGTFKSAPPGLVAVALHHVERGGPQPPLSWYSFGCFFCLNHKLSGRKQEGTATRRHGVHDGRNGCAAVHLVAAESTCCYLCRGVHPSLCTRGLTLFDSINFIKHVVP